MALTNPLVRSLHDLGLAAWFGGSFMANVGLHGAAEEVADPRQRARVPSAGWNRWAPIQNAGIGTHLLSAALLTRANRGRLVAQRGVTSLGVAKGAVTILAVAATAYAARLGNTIDEAGDPPIAEATEPAPDTPPDVAAAQRRLHLVQWSVPALTGALVVMNAVMGEQQRPKAVAAGVARRLAPRL
ncbi:MAG: hypothetical protein ICV74_10735 [Thermoleophilia bacterium]|nr:hypothetical protein [Thermoleophilia bacterium]